MASLVDKFLTGVNYIKSAPVQIQKIDSFRKNKQTAAQGVSVDESRGQQVQKKLSDIVDRSAPRQTSTVKALLNGTSEEEEDQKEKFRQLPAPVRSTLNRSIGDYLSNKKFNTDKPEVQQEIEKLKNLT